MAIRVFYHSADLDGMCSGAIVKYRFPDVVMHPINYGDEFPFNEIEPEDTVYMVDFCLQPFGFMQRLSMLLAGTGELIVIDHHKTTLDEWSKSHTVYGNWLLQTDKAACELTWEYLFPDKPVPLAVKLLSLYDSWRFQGHELEDMVLPFQVRMRMEDLDPHNKHSDHAMSNWTDFFEEPIHLNITKLIEEGRLLLRYDEANKAKYARTYAFETTLHLFSHQVIRPRAFKAIAVNLGHTNSKVFDSVYDPAKHELMVTFVRRVDKLWNVSLYSTKPEIDCGEIAKSFGGGGHKGAAGFQGKELPFKI